MKSFFMDKHSSLFVQTICDLEKTFYDVDTDQVEVEIKRFSDNVYKVRLDNQKLLVSLIFLAKYHKERN
jgi:hypothetical protein